MRSRHKTLKMPWDAMDDPQFTFLEKIRGREDIIQDFKK